MSQSNIVVLADCALTYTDKKGATHAVSAEGAMFSANKELQAQKLDMAAMSAVSKALNGRFAAAVDIFAVVFPTPCKQLADIARNKKFTFLALCEVIDGLAPKAEKGWNEKQLRARKVAKFILAAEHQREAERLARAADKAGVTDDHGNVVDVVTAGA